MSNQSGIPLGALWGFLIITAFIYAYVGLGVYFIWQTPMPAAFFGWIKLIFSSFGYLLAGIICFSFTLFIALYFVIRDRDLGATLRNHWPVFAAVIYMIVNPVPGPVDDVVVALICAGLESYKIVHRIGR